ncbi:hypothetical protein F5Y10DRAFT_291536 [Nemania abortiva]|nr:hypothetical protein F5Y10DRAFT_291536 [Nemania abortiva]
MTTQQNKSLWVNALNEYKTRLGSEDLEFFLNVPQDPNNIATALVASADKQLAAGPTTQPHPTIDRIKRLTKLFAIFTVPVPEVSNVVWISLYLLHERSNINADTRALFQMAVDEITSSVPQFKDYEEVFSDMKDVEDALLQFYFKVIELFLAILERIKRSSPWHHRLGLLGPPVAIDRAVRALKTQKEIVERQVFTANTMVQSKRHKEIHDLLSQLSTRQKPEPNLPCRVIPYSINPDFHGRKEILNQLEAHLVISKNVRSSIAISGLGGVGKTQIALKYIYDHFDQFQAILWMQSDTHQKLAQSYINAAKSLELEHEDSQRDADAVATVLKDWLSKTTDHWLIVFDNADDLSVLKPFWPIGHRGCIIITSRDPAAARVANAGIDVPPFSSTEGETFFVSLLTRRSDSAAAELHDAKLVKGIVKELGYLPLAITQVASFIVEHSCTLEEFQELRTEIQRTNQYLWDMDSSTTNLFYEHSLATVWKVSLAKLSPNSIRLLRILSFLDPDGVPEHLIWDGSKTQESLSSFRLGVPYLNALRELISRGLVTKSNSGASTGYNTSSTRSLSMHRLVQETIFHQLEGEDQNRSFNDALQVLFNAWPVNHENPFRMNALWPTYSLYLPHVLALEARIRDSPSIQPPATIVSLFFYASFFLYERRMPEYAFPLLHTARDICAKTGNVDPFFPKLLTAFGSVYLECDKVSLARDMFEQVVDKYRKRPEPKDWLLATALSDLGCALTGLRNYERAEELFREGLDIANGLSGREGLDWQAHVGHNLSRLLIKLGRPEEALKLQFLHGDEFAGGLIQENSQRGALFIYGIGNAYEALGKQKGIEGAEERRVAYSYHARAFDVRFRLCGETFITGISLHKVGVLLSLAGDLAAAEALLQRAINVFQSSFNADNEAARSLFHLSLVQDGLSKEAQAISTLAQAWEYQERITGVKRTTENEKNHALFDDLVLYVFD